MVKVFRGNEIDEDCIAKLKCISCRRYSKEIYQTYFSAIENVNDLANLHNIRFDKEVLVLGTDWFLCYTTSDYDVQFLEWVSVDNENRIKQATEIMNVLKNILIKNKGKMFHAIMRHATSYQIYLKILERGYFREIKHDCLIDCAAPDLYYDKERMLMDVFNSIEDFLCSEECSNYSEYLKYILHQLNFVVTNKFLKKYSNSGNKNKSKKIRGRIINIKNKL